MPADIEYYEGVIELHTIKQINMNPKAKTIFGYFFFQDEGNGHLRSEYTEHSETISYPESCIKSNDSPASEDTWAGIYLTTWSEADNSYTATLSIEKQGGDMYVLNWTNLVAKNGERRDDLNYRGTAKFEDGKLRGTYWNR